MSSKQRIQEGMRSLVCFALSSHGQSPAACFCWWKMLPPLEASGTIPFPFLDSLCTLRTCPNGLAKPSEQAFSTVGEGPDLAVAS